KLSVNAIRIFWTIRSTTPETLYKYIQLPSPLISQSHHRLFVNLVTIPLYSFQLRNPIHVIKSALMPNERELRVRITQLTNHLVKAAPTAYFAKMRPEIYPIRKRPLSLRSQLHYRRIQS